ncbi:MAG: hypothetical protein U5K28_02085 [Halobacteriales archaeon]|nr:hypothetical protein [Halobacteriales archaeon]
MSEPAPVRAEVIHVVAPDEFDEYELQPALVERATGRYLLVCRKGGSPSWFERVKLFLRREGIEAITLVSDEPREEGDEIDVSVTETELAGVYEVVSED